MSTNKLLIAAAGAGKTTFLVKEALKIKEDNVLITTYTLANEEQIRDKFFKLNKCIPKNITIQTWFSFLIQHGVRPYQGAYNDLLFEKRINGIFFTQNQSGIRHIDINGKKIYWGEDDFEKYYFNPSNQIFSDKVSKFVIKCNDQSNGSIFDRLSRIYTHLFIDEVQDLAGWDLEVLKHLFKSRINILLVGDPRQVTYLTHHDRKYPNYKNGKIKQFIIDKCIKVNCLIDETTLKYSHRNNPSICTFSSKLYPLLVKSEPCSCIACRSINPNHTGVFIISEDQVEDYRRVFTPTVLRFENAVSPEWNFGKSKGLEFDRVLIYPTKTITTYLKDGKLTKVVKNKTQDSFDIAKFYVAVTRAKYSVAIIYDFDDNETFIEGVNKWSP